MSNNNLKSFLIFVAVIALAGGGLFFLKNGLGSSADVAPQNVTVGNVKGDSVDISWITSDKTTSQLQYGETPVLGKTMAVPGLALAHLVTVDSLKPNTTYYFQVGNVAASDQPFTFRTLAEVKSVPDTASAETSPDTKSQLAVASPFGKLINSEPNKPRVLAESTDSGTPVDQTTQPTGTPQTGSLGLTILAAAVFSLLAGFGFKLLKN